MRNMKYPYGLDIDINTDLLCENWLKSACSPYFSRTSPMR